jgi:hypothetical protein
MIGKMFPSLLSTLALAFKTHVETSKVRFSGFIPSKKLSPFVLPND